MEARKNTLIAPTIRVKDMQNSLDFYTNPFGRQTSGTNTRKDGQIVHASVGFDSPLLMLSPPLDVGTRGNRTKNTLSVGVEFYIGMNGSKKLDAFFTQVKAKGVSVINEPKSEPGETGYSY